MESSPRKIDIGKVLNETFSTYGQHAGPLLGAALIVFLIVGILQALFYAAGGILFVLLAIVVSVVGLTLYTGFVVRLVEDVRDGRRDFTVGELFSSAAEAVWRLIGNGILKAIAVAIGFLILIVPGLVLLTIWAVTAPAIVVERAGIIDAFSRSWELVKGNAWAVFAVIVIVFVITAVISAILNAIGAAIGDAGAIVLGIVAAIVTAPIGALAASVLFFDLGGGAKAPEPADAGFAPAPEA